MRRATLRRVLAMLLVGGLILIAGGWGTLALGFAGPQPVELRYGLSGAFAFASLLTLVGLGFHRWRRRALGLFAALFAVLLAWWHGLEPSNQRDWQADVAVLPYATVEGDLVRMHNIRNFVYRSENDYTPGYYDRRFDLRQLEGVDLIASYWTGPAIAHVFLSFAFSDGEHLAVSIETRREKGEGYSTLRGLFRQYELYYVVADERDVIGLRANHRRHPPEQVYLYRLQVPIEDVRRLFLEYLHEINALHDRPRFYNALTTNCTTSVWMNTRVNPDHLPFDWRLLVSGYVPRLLYEHGRLDSRGQSFADLQHRALINARAQAADGAEDFSRRIRERRRARPFRSSARTLVAGSETKR